MAVPLEQFIERLLQSGLMPEADVQSFIETLPAEKQPKDTAALAKELVQAKKLTKYQAQAIYSGKAGGLVFGEYVVLDKIGEGGMGVVLKARHRRMDRLVAIKILPAASVDSAEAIQRFYREVKAAAKLSHPNIVTSHDAGEHQGMHFLVMEFVEGKDLASIAKERGPLPVREAMGYIVQAARGLQYAHEEGVVHRDIKPANLLRDKKGTIKILDMGLARFAGSEPSLGGGDRLTTTGQVMGTCDYMAPEQAEDTHAADHRADIYSLGCTLYRLVTGGAPYPRDTLMKILMAHREAPIPSLAKQREDVPPEVDAIFQKMVAKRPDDRYQSMLEVVAALDAVLGDRTTVSSSSTTSGDQGDPSLEEVLSFLNQPVKATVQVKQASAATEETIDQHIERETGSKLVKPAASAAPSRTKKSAAAWLKPPKLWLSIGGGLVGLVVLLAVIISLRTKDGTLIVEVDDPQATITVLDEKAEVVVQRKGDKGTIHLSVPAGRGKIRLEKNGDEIFAQEFTLVAGGQEYIKAKFVAKLAPKPPAARPTTDEAPNSWTLPNGWRFGPPVNLGPTINSSGSLALRAGQLCAESQKNMAQPTGPATPIPRQCRTARLGEPGYAYSGSGLPLVSGASQISTRPRM